MGKRNSDSSAETGQIIGLPPSRPSLFVGREQTMVELKRRLGIGPDAADLPDPITVIHAYPGMGKTATASMLAHDPEVAAAYPDGILWADLGAKPDLIQELGNWGQPLGNETIRHHPKSEVGQAAAKIRTLLQGRRALLIVDDVWEEGHGDLFLAARGSCPIVLTSRFHEFARKYCLTFPQGRFRLRELAADHALNLLNLLVPEVVTQNQQSCRQLVRDLEGLPLAILVAGGMLGEAQEDHLEDVESLLESLRSGAQLLEQTAPADRTDFQHETAEIPTVGALLRRSIDTLSPTMRRLFTLLGAFPGMPASFGLEAVQAQWQVGDPRPSLRTLKRRGLLERNDDGRFQMHALLHSLASTMYQDSLAAESVQGARTLAIDFGDDDD